MIKVLCAFIQLQDFTLTEVTENLIRWRRYFDEMTSKFMTVDMVRFRQYPFSRNFNEIVRYAIENDYDYLFQYDADMIGNPVIIERLVEHRKECVGALFFSRQYPHPAQLWMIEPDCEGGIKHFWEVDHKSIRKLLAEGHRSLLRTDARGGGFTLFSVPALRQFEYPYVQFTPNQSNPFLLNGIDMDICWKITKKFGGVYTDFSSDFNVKHITFDYVGTNKL